MSFISKKVIAVPIFLFVTEPLLAEDFHWKLRARESYDILRVHRDTHAAEYPSFSHTINLFYEKPFDRAFGLAIGPFGFSYSIKKQSRYFSEKLRLISYGFEYKTWWPSQFFIRAGLYYNYMNTNTVDDGVLHGGSIYLGGGYEWNIKDVGLAVEIGHRRHFFPSNWSIENNSVALGVHFYPML